MALLAPTCYSPNDEEPSVGALPARTALEDPCLYGRGFAPRPLKVVPGDPAAVKCPKVQLEKPPLFNEVLWCCLLMSVALSGAHITWVLGPDWEATMETFNLRLLPPSPCLEPTQTPGEVIHRLRPVQSQLGNICPTGLLTEVHGQLRLSKPARRPDLRYKPPSPGPSAEGPQGGLNKSVVMPGPESGALSPLGRKHLITRERQRQE